MKQSLAKNWVKLFFLKEGNRTRMLNTVNLSLHFDGRPLFDDVSIQFLEGNCYGIIGANGAGKSTFLKLLSGELEPTKGYIHKTQGKRLSFLKQDHFQYDQYSVIETVIMGNEKLYQIMKEKDEIYAKTDFSEADGMRAGELEEAFADLDGWNAESDAAILLNGLGIEGELQQEKMENLNGNDKVKVLLAQAIFGNPDILLLDEPTNHLDIEAVQWLEEYIINLESLVIIVSHDRHFLNKTCTQIADIDYGKIQLFVGNYDFWYQSSQLIQKQLRESNRKKEEKMKELQDFIDRFSANASKSKQATSRKQSLQKIQLDELKASNRRHPFVEFKPERELGTSVLAVENLYLTMDDGEQFGPYHFAMGKNDKIALIGQQERLNTALLSTLAQEHDAIKWGASARVAYFPKNFEHEFENELTIVEWLAQYTTETDVSIIRSFLGRMLFSGEDALKKVKVLSGGEKVRCMLSKMMILGANVLIFDDPTNHLDMESITALNNALVRFKGATIFSTHDFQIIQSTASRIMRFSDQGVLEDYPYTYEEYIERRSKKA